MLGKPIVELLVPKGESNNGSDNIGACLQSQKWSMIFYLLAEEQLLNLRVVPISENEIPINYPHLEVGRHLPIVILTKLRGDINLSDSSRMIAETEDERDEMLLGFQSPNLAPSNAYISTLCDIGGGMNLLLEFGDETRITKALQNLNEVLSRNKKRFIDSDNPAYVDCAIAPKLQHLRVAAAYYRNFHIPTYFTDLWTYVSRLYSLEAFRVSCPSDKNIILHNLHRLCKNDHQLYWQEKKRIMNLEDGTTNSLPHFRRNYYHIDESDQSYATNDMGDPHKNTLDDAFDTSASSIDSCVVDPSRSSSTSPTKMEEPLQLPHSCIPFHENRRFIYRQIPPARYFNYYEQIVNKNALIRKVLSSSSDF